MSENAGSSLSSRSPGGFERHCIHTLAISTPDRDRLLVRVEGRRQIAIQQRDVDLLTIPEDERGYYRWRLDAIIAENEKCQAEIRAGQMPCDYPPERLD